MIDLLRIMYTLPFYDYVHVPALQGCFLRHFLAVLRFSVFGFPRSPAARRGAEIICCTSTELAV